MDQFADAITILGVYAALMAVLAVCVEAVLGSFKTFWPALQGRPSPEALFKDISYWLPEEDSRKMQARVNALNNLLGELLPKTHVNDDEVVQLSENPTGEAIGKAVNTLKVAHIGIERKRRLSLRTMAVLLGFGFAALFQIDTVQILAPLMPASDGMWHMVVTTDTTHFLGLVLSGLAASAGSSFWHDKSAQLRNLKGISQKLKELKETV